MKIADRFGEEHEIDAAIHPEWGRVIYYDGDPYTVDDAPPDRPRTRRQRRRPRRHPDRTTGRHMTGAAWASTTPGISQLGVEGGESHSLVSGLRSTCAHAAPPRTRGETT